MFLNRKIDFDSIAIENDEGDYKTYNDLEKEAYMLKRIIGNERETVLIIADKSIESVSIYYYCLSNNYVPLVIDEKIDLCLLNSLIKNYKFNYIFCRNHKNTKEFVDMPEVYSFGKYSLLLNNPTPYCLHPELALLMSTSGSTGGPKCTRVTYNSLLESCNVTADFLDTRQDDIGMMILPMAFCFGQIFLLIHFLRGAKICVSKYSVFEKGFWSFYDSSNITNFFCVPSIIYYLKRLLFFEHDYPSLRYFCQGGEKADNSVINAFCSSKLSSHCNYYNVYGLTEALMISCLQTKYLLSKPGSVGIPFPGISVSINGGTNNGEIIVEGSNVFWGYANNFYDLSRGDEVGGMLMTGDIGTFDKDGFLYITGRKSRFSKIAGLRISHDEIERILKDKFSNVDFACIGNDSVIYIICEGQIDVNSVINYICSSIHLNNHFIRATCVHSLPISTNGKTNYSMLKESFLKDS